MEKLLTTIQVASILKISTSTVRRLYRDGEIQYLKLGHRSIRFYSYDIEDYLERKKPKEIRQILDIKPVAIDFKKLSPAGVG